jgi:hypothetical protein
VIELHGGVIRVHTDESGDAIHYSRKGTTYEIEIPCVRVGPNIQRPSPYEEMMYLQSFISEKYSSQSSEEEKVKI